MAFQRLDSYLSTTGNLTPVSIVNNESCMGMPPNCWSPKYFLLLLYMVTWRINNQCSLLPFPRLALPSIFTQLKLFWISIFLSRRTHKSIFSFFFVQFPQLHSSYQWPSIPIYLTLAFQDLSWTFIDCVICQTIVLLMPMPRRLFNKRHSYSKIFLTCLFVYSSHLYSLPSHKMWLWAVQNKKLIKK